MQLDMVEQEDKATSQLMGAVRPSFQTQHDGSERVMLRERGMSVPWMFVDTT